MLTLSCSITINKNSVPGDKSALSPGGVRLGSAALTTRGFGPAEFTQVAELLDRVVRAGLDIQAKSGSKLLKDFVVAAQGSLEVAKIKEDVMALATRFPMPGANGL